jgi:hypothetical protein
VVVLYRGFTVLLLDQVGPVLLVLEVLEDGETVAAQSGQSQSFHPAVSADAVRMAPLVDDVHGYGDEVDPGTLEFGVFGLAELAPQHLKLVDNILIFVTEVGVEFVVHLRLLENVDQLLMLQIVDHGVHDGLYFEVLALFGDEVEVDKEGVVFRLDFDGVDHLVVKRTAWLFADISDFT